MHHRPAGVCLLLLLVRSENLRLAQSWELDRFYQRLRECKEFSYNIDAYIITRIRAVYGLRLRGYTVRAAHVIMSLYNN